MKKPKKEKKKLSRDEKIQLWSDRLVIILSIVLFLLAVVGFAWFQFNKG